VSVESDRALLAERVTALVSATLPGATFMDLPTPMGAEAVSFAGYDEADVRPATALVAALAEALRADGRRTAPASDDDTEGLHVAKEGLGGGVFGVQTSVISFMGLPQLADSVLPAGTVAGAAGGGRLGWRGQPG
jgi:hypothetical protein